MKKALIVVAVVIVACLALYGLVQLVSLALTEEHGKKAVSLTTPFTRGVAQAVGEQLKDAISKAPAEQLEKDGELLGRKAYPMSKGLIRGQIKAMKEDPDREELARIMRELGKVFSEEVAKPFAKGIADGSTGIMDGLNKTVENFREFSQRHKNLFDALMNRVKALRKEIGENAPGIPPRGSEIPAPSFNPAPPEHAPPSGYPPPDQRY